MRLRYLALICGMVSVAGGAWAHDEGHGPKLTDTPTKGGVVSPVIDMKSIKKGSKAEVIYKAELVRAEDGKVSVFLYDSSMKLLDLSRFGSKADAKVEVKIKKKFSETPFSLSAAGDSFSGQMPKPKKKPYNIDVILKEGERQLLAAFDNLD